MWQADIDSNVASVAASNAADTHHQNGAMDQFHSDDFLLYAFLQTGQDARARAVIDSSAAALAHFETMPEMGDGYMEGMFPYYRTKLPVFFALEMRDWTSAAALEPVPGATPETQTLTYWARAVADGHLHQPQQARAALGQYDALGGEGAPGKARLLRRFDRLAHRARRDAGLGGVRGRRFGGGSRGHARSADLQDKVGQGEVDIPAREMLADMLLELGQPRRRWPNTPRRSS
jgi:hypothetical protein